MNKKLLATVAAVLAIGAGVAIAQVTLPQVTQINSDDLIQIIPHGVPRAGNVYASAPLLGNYGATQGGNSAENAIIGGDFGQNLWQDGTTSASTTTTLLYQADQWFGWSGTSTAFTTIKETAAADITAGYGASARVIRTSGQTGVIPICVGQEIETAQSYRFQGGTAEFDFHAIAGSGFTAASNNLNVSIVYGTGADEGATKLAFQFNGGGGGSSTWAGQTNAASNLVVPITSGWNRYSVVAKIPATATEIAAIICYTPVGTAGASDYYEFTGAQLVVNSSLTTVAGASGAVLSPNDVRAKSTLRRPQSVSTAEQYRFYWRQDEAANSNVVYGMCQGLASTTASNCMMTLPVTMRTTPTLAYTAGTIVASDNTAGAATAVSALALQTAPSTSPIMAYMTATNTSAATQTGFLRAGNSTGGGKIAFSARF